MKYILGRLPARLLRSVIIAYRYLFSGFLPPACRFHPSCSQYAVDALDRHGLLRGVYLIGGRLARCHPLHEGGFDPVPETDSCCSRHHRPLP